MSGHDTISMLCGMISYCAKFTGEHLSHYLNQIESVGLRKAFLLAPDRRSDCKAAKQNVYF